MRALLATAVVVLKSPRSPPTGPAIGAGSVKTALWCVGCRVVDLVGLCCFWFVLFVRRVFLETWPGAD